MAVEDKSLSMAFNVVFMSLFAMLPAPMVYGAIIDNTCILWQASERSQNIGSWILMFSIKKGINYH